MRITCPSCAAEYDVPGSLAPGRAVRCARCGNQWAPVAPLPPPPVETAPEPEPEPQPIVVPITPPAPLVARPPEKVASRWPLLLAWAGSAAVIVALLAVAFFWREPIMAAWPPSMRVYSALRLTAHP